MKTNVRWMGPGTMRFIADTGSGIEPERLEQIAQE